MTLSFSRSLYDADAIRETAEAYAELATWTVIVEQYSVSVVCTDPNPDIADLSDHFANHALHLSIANTRRAAGGAH